MPIKDVLASLGSEIEDVDEEIFLLFSQDIPSQNLGFVDPKAQTLSVTVAGRDFTIHQSPAVLSSSRAGGTTGAVLWKITPLLASWLSTPNPLSNALITPQTTILELGCGISALTALALGPKVSRYILTDQAYVSKLVAENLAENLPAPKRKPSSKVKSAVHDHKPTPNITFTPLDWELNSPSPSLTGTPAIRSFDLVLACDCIYNDALIQPFVQTCVEACRLRVGDGDGVEGGEAKDPCVCLVSQQLRDSDVFGGWLAAFSESFSVWRVPDEMLTGELRPGFGFVVHVGILKRN